MPLHNRKYLKTYRKGLRNNLTPSEARLWKALKGRGLAGRKFRRQHSIGNYIVDFYCYSAKLAIEVDGAYHQTPSVELADQKRDAYLQSQGIKVLRIPNEVVHKQFDLAIEAILEALGEQGPPPAPPGRRGESKDHS